MYIGIIGRLQTMGRGYYSFNREIIQVIRDYQAIPIPFIFNFENNVEEEFLKYQPMMDLCSGFILQGGSDYEDIDLYVAKYLYKNNIPTLGICLGMQTMSMAFEGKMGTIENHKKEGYVHAVQIYPNTKLHSILKKDYILVNSRHHDYIISTNLKVSSKYDVIEAVEAQDKLFFIGLQWHPETLRDENSEKIFQEFFKNARKYKKM